jgi:hypothetical protein
LLISSLYIAIYIYDITIFVYISAKLMPKLQRFFLNTIFFRNFAHRFAKK